MRTVLVTSLVLVAACGGGGIPEDQFAAKLYAAECQSLLVRCGGFASYYCDSLTVGSGVMTASTDFMTAVTKGRVHYDPGKASQCLDAVANLPCTVLGLPSVCYDAFQGTVAVGGSCYSTADCASGTCSATASSCPGTCQSFPSVCHSNADCDPRSSNTTCNAAGACVPFTPAKAGDACRTDPDCDANLVCDRSPTGFTCAAPLADGAACTGGSPSCPRGEVCKGAGQSQTGMPIGGTCAAADDVGGSCVPPTGLLGVTGCRFGLACIGGTCQIPPTSGPCARDTLATCKLGVSYCDSSATCQPLKAVGGSCQSGIECQSGNCEGATSTCAAPIGASCHEA